MHHAYCDYLQRKLLTLRIFLLQNKLVPKLLFANIFRFRNKNSNSIYIPPVLHTYPHNNKVHTPTSKTSSDREKDCPEIVTEFPLIRNISMETSSSVTPLDACVLQVIYNYIVITTGYLLSCHEKLFQHVTLLNNPVLTD